MTNQTPTPEQMIEWLSNYPENRSYRGDDGVMCDRIIDFIATHSKEREGWRLVPIEPTVEMKDAGDDLLYDTLECAHNVYNAMLNAAPPMKGDDDE